MEDAKKIYGQLHRSLVERIEDNPEITDREVQDLIGEMVLSDGRARSLTLRQKEALQSRLFSSIRKLDILQELIDDPDVTEIMVNGYRHIFYEKNGHITQWDKAFLSEERLMDVVQQIAGRCNRIVNEQSPIVDARLADGSRVNIVLPPVALEGAVMTIRRFPQEPITMRDLVRLGSLTPEAASFLRDLVEARYSVLIGGGTSTGKTTFLNALSAYIPKSERIVTIEDNAELQIQGVENLVRMEARNAGIDGNSEISIRDLIRTSLRMRPDRIIVGEVRGAEAVDFLSCLNTGHSGSLGTAHANSVRDMISRLEVMVLMGAGMGANLSVPVIRRQIAAGVEILVHLTRDAFGVRQVDEIAEIVGMDGDDVEISTIYKRNFKGILEPKGELRHREKMEKLYERRQK